MITNWIKLLLQHFDKHKIQGRIFFGEIGLSIVLWSIIIAIHIGEAIQKCN